MGLFNLFRRKKYKEYEEEDEYEIEGETVDVEANATLDGNLEIKMFKPEDMTQMLTCVNYLKDGKTVLLNFEGVDNQLYRRMIDFISGACFALSLAIKKSGERSFCIAPNEVDISGELFDEQDDDDEEFFDI
ncbi:MAG: cell division protein SepF [Clostridia bacterium]|nr:cell division protein SepF [Clostridia bacterium]